MVPKHKRLGLLAALFATLGAVPPLALNGVLLRGDGPWITAGSELLMLPGLVGLALTVFALPFVAFTRTRAVSTFILASSSALFFGTIVGTIGGGAHRMSAFRIAATRAEPLVAAIFRFESETGRPPSSLGELTPNYLGAIPSGVPPLELVSGEQARVNYGGNSWILRADVGTGLLNWDEFLYFPLQNYPPHFERVGKWAYVHD